MTKPPKDDPQLKQALKRMAQLARRQAGLDDDESDEPPVIGGLPPGWEMESVNIEDDIVIHPDQSLAAVTIIVRSFTFINPETGETVTTPSSVPPAS